MNNQARKRSGLGRGLASLIPTGPAESGEPATLGPKMGAAAADVVLGGAPVAAPEPAPETNPVGAVYREIAPSQIDPNPRQPRQVFDEEALAELVHSIREFGLMQPIVVRAVPAGDEASSPRYQLVMGSAAGVPPSWPRSQRSPRSSARPPMTACCAMPCWRTSIECN